MPEALRTIEIDGRQYQVQFEGFHTDLRVAVAGGAEVTLPPWRLADHLAALDQSVRLVDGEPALDVQAFAGAVLARGGADAAAAHATLAPLALWWAAGGGEAAPSGRSSPSGAHGDGWLDLGPVRVRVRPWTLRERLHALAGQLRETRDRRDSDDGAGELALVPYLEAMIAVSAAERIPVGFDLGGLDASQSAALLAAVLAANVPDSIEAELEALGPGLGPRAAVTMLRVCRALGWTPSQVLAAPAAEIARVERLLEMAEPDAGDGAAARTAPLRGGVSGHSAWVEDPDAVVIRIDADEEGA